MSAGEKPDPNIPLPREVIIQGFRGVKVPSARAEQNSCHRIGFSEVASRRSPRRLSRIAKGGGLISLQASRAIVDIETPRSTPQPGMAERAIDTATDVSRTITELSAALQAAVNQLSRAIVTARRSEPLSTVRAITREAPLASLFVAFLLGLAIARRR
jgi:hypothetical protein